MPFTVDGQWVPKEPEKPAAKTPQKPATVRLEKRGNNLVTVVLNLSMPEMEILNFLSEIKRKFGCGGTAKDSTIEIQGDKTVQIKEFLKHKGIKVNQR